MHIFSFLPSLEKSKFNINLTLFSRAKDRVNTVEKRKEERSKKAKGDFEDKKVVEDDDDSGISIIWLYSSVLKASVIGGFLHILTVLRIQLILMRIRFRILDPH